MGTKMITSISYGGKGVTLCTSYAKRDSVPVTEDPFSSDNLSPGSPSLSSESSSLLSIDPSDDEDEGSTIKVVETEAGRRGIWSESKIASAWLAAACASKHSKLSLPDGPENFWSWMRMAPVSQSILAKSNLLEAGLNLPRTMPLNVSSELAP